MANELCFSSFVRHLTLLFCTIHYTLAVLRFKYSTVAEFSYRLAFISAAFTYGIVVFKAYRTKIQRGYAGNIQQQAMGLLGDENVQYLSECPALRNERF